MTGEVVADAVAFVEALGGHADGHADRGLRLGGSATLIMTISLRWPKPPQRSSSPATSTCSMPISNPQRSPPRPTRCPHPIRRTLIGHECVSRNAVSGRRARWLAVVGVSGARQSWTNGSVIPQGGFWANRYCPKRCGRCLRRTALVGPAIGLNACGPAAHTSMECVVRCPAVGTSRPRPESSTSTAATAAVRSRAAARCAGPHQSTR